MKLIFSSTLHPTSTTGQGFGMHEGAPPSHDPQASTRAGDVWWLPLSNQLFDHHCYHQRCLLELQFHLIYYQCPQNPGPHISPPGATSPSPRIATARLVSSSTRPSPALPLHGGPQPILGSSYLQECAWCQGLGLSPAVSLRSLLPRGIALPSPQKAATPEVPCHVFL